MQLAAIFTSLATPSTRTPDAGRLRKNNRQATTALPAELAFWALWHCRHARPPDAARLA
ncbi:hypothetical protein [Pseudomonas cavernae]|uniref:hypothetical protein n=1 Tax=Pseudomonas cavernae TaxID=2320867 RepID=UPI0013C44440|nr:hypothetical protein [Pseudomonas cavernae]